MNLRNFVGVLNSNLDDSSISLEESEARGKYLLQQEWNLAILHPFQPRRVVGEILQVETPERRCTRINLYKTIPLENGGRLLPHEIVIQETPEGMVRRDYKTIFGKRIPYDGQGEVPDEWLGLCGN